MASFHFHQTVKRKDAFQHMKVEEVTTAADGTKLVACWWADQWGRTQRETFPADTLEAVPEHQPRPRRRRH
jgi:hypothetical protein